MDRSQIIEAFRTTKAIVMSHGIFEHMTDYNRKALASEVPSSATHLRFDFHLNPKESIWSTKNPGCGFTVSYSCDHDAKYLAPNGDSVADNKRSITCRLSGDDMPLEIMRKREALIEQFMMLCSMLESVLPAKIVTVVESASELTERVKREAEQKIGHAIHSALGAPAFKGLRKGGKHRVVRIPSEYLAANESFPAPGSYRYTHVRRYNSRGTAVEKVKYMIKVFSADGKCYIARVE